MKIHPMSLGSRSFLPAIGDRGCGVFEGTRDVGAGLTAQGASLIKSVILVPHGIGDNAGALSINP